ncbi:MAG: hypothetical protein AAB249_06130, partial [Acidobacteriota bacterium]
MMDCETNRRQIVLMLCGELEDAGRQTLDSHLEACAVCAAALAEERRLLQLLEGAPAAEPSSDLLEGCRRDLRAALKAGSAGRRLPAPLGMRLWPAWAFALLAAGFVAGRLAPGAGRPGAGGELAAPEAGAT